MILRSIIDRPEIDLLVSCSGKEEASARWVQGPLERGESRLGWCRMAMSEDGELLAAHALDSWSPDHPPGERPTFAQLLGHTDEQAAVALLEHDLRAFDVTSLQVRLVSDADAAPELRMLRDGQRRVLLAAGFHLEVDRVRVEWRGPPKPRQEVGLLFAPVATTAESDLVEVFAAVGDGSLDHAIVTGRVEHGRQGEALIRLDRARRRRYADDWFVIGVNGAGVPIGYVQSALAENDRAILAEVGVVESQRGHRHVDELLSYATGVLTDHGQRHIRAYTDAANHGMRAGFARAGYAETGSRCDFRRRRALRAGPPDVARARAAAQGRSPDP